LWRLTKPKVVSEMRELQLRLKEARKRHQKTRHIEAQIRAITTLQLQRETQRFQ